MSAGGAPGASLLNDEAEIDRVLEILAPQLA